MAAKVGQLVVDFFLNTGKFESDIKKTTRSFKKFGRDMSAAGKTLFTGLTLPIVAAGAAFVKIADDFDAGMKTIRAGTGATGSALEALGKDMRAVVGEVPASIDEVSKAIASLNTRLGLTGKPLQDMAANTLELSRITGTDATQNIASITRAFGDWSIGIDKQNDAMNIFLATVQQTDIPLTRLTDLVTQFGAPMRALGFSFEETAALMGKWEKEGVNLETVMSGLRFGLGEFAKAGREPAAAFRETMEAIKNAGSESEATAIAFKAFGKRAAIDLSRAIMEGRFEIDDLVDSLINSQESIKQVGQETRTFAESMTMLKNKLFLALEPLGVQLLKTFENLRPQFEAVISAVAALAKWFGDLPQPIQTTLIAVAGLVAALGPVLMLIGAMSTGIGTLLPLFGKVALALKGVSLATIGMTAGLAAVAVAIIIYKDEIAGAIAKTLEWIGVAKTVKSVQEDAAGSSKIYARMAKEVGVTTEELTVAARENRKEMLALESAKNQGKITYEQYLVSIKNLVRGEKDQAKTTTDVAAAIKDVVTQVNQATTDIKKNTTAIEKQTKSLAETRQEWIKLFDAFEDHAHPSRDIVESIQDDIDTIKGKVGELPEPRIWFEGPKAMGESIQDLLDPSKVGSLPTLETQTGQTVSRVRQEISTVWDDFHKNISEAIRHWSGFKDAVISFSDSMSDVVIRTFTDKLFKPLENLIGKAMDSLFSLLGKIPGLGGVFGGGGSGGGVLSTVTGGGGGAGGAISNVLSSAGPMGWINMGANVVSAIGSIGMLFGNWKDHIRATEQHTRYTSLIIQAVADKLDEIRDLLWNPIAEDISLCHGALESIKWDMLAPIRDTLKSMGGFGDPGALPEAGAGATTNIANSNYNWTVNISIANADEETVKRELIPVLKRELVGGNTGLREAVRQSYDSTRGAY